MVNHIEKATLKAFLVFSHNKEIIEKWSKLKDKNIEEFKDICNYLGMAFNIEAEKDCLDKYYFCIVKYSFWFLV